MQYRIRKDKQHHYIPEMRGWSTLWLWLQVPDISGVYSIMSHNLGRFREENAEKVIQYHKEYEARVEEIRSVK